MKILFTLQSILEVSLLTYLRRRNLVDLQINHSDRRERMEHLKERGDDKFIGVTM